LPLLGGAASHGPGDEGRQYIESDEVKNAVVDWKQYAVEVAVFAIRW